jgi:surfeit locus 1 family protein
MQRHAGRTLGAQFKRLGRIWGPPAYLTRLPAIVTRRLSAGISAADERAQRLPPLGDDPPRRRRAESTEALFFGLPVAVTFSLGVWQVRRLQRKRALVASRVASLAEEPLVESDLARILEGETDDPARPQDYRHVALKGNFLRGSSDNPDEVLVGPRPAPSDVASSVLQWGGASGLKVVAPFRTEQGRTVLVIRGWIPQRLVKAQERRHAAITPQGRLSPADTVSSDAVREDAESKLITIEGVMRSSREDRNRFTPDNCPRTGDWFYVDSVQMMDTFGLRGTPPGTDEERTLKQEPPWVIELSSPVPPGGWPHPRPSDEYVNFRTPPSTHVIYAVTWFSLSAALALLTRQKYRLRRRSDGTGKPPEARSNQS